MPSAVVHRALLGRSLILKLFKLLYLDVLPLLFTNFLSLFYFKQLKLKTSLLKLQIKCGECGGHSPVIGILDRPVYVGLLLTISVKAALSSQLSVPKHNKELCDFQFSSWITVGKNACYKKITACIRIIQKITLKNPTTPSVCMNI